MQIKIIPQAYLSVYGIERSYALIIDNRYFCIFKKINELENFIRGRQWIKID